MSYINTGGEKYGDRNCGLCTIGAIIGQPSGQVANMLGFQGIENEEIFAAAEIKRHGHDLKTYKADGTQMQKHSLEGMRYFLKRVTEYLKSECYLAQGGSETSLVPFPVLESLMRQYVAGTKFAVYGSMAMNGLGAHWNYAERTATGIEYRDYQYNDADAHPPKVSDRFIAPKANSGDSSSYVKGVVIVFAKTKNPRAH